MERTTIKKTCYLVLTIKILIPLQISAFKIRILITFYIFLYICFVHTLRNSLRKW